MIYSFGDRVPTIAADCFVAPSADVMGSVTLQERVSVWFNVVIRGDCEQITVGARSNIQDCAVLHADEGVPLTIGSGVTMGHQAMVHGCTIGDDTLIGINAVVMNHARIGRHCLIGVNALVTEGKEIPDGSLVIGSPGRVVRSLTDAEREMVEDAARHYVENGQRFRGQLKAM